MLMDDKGCWTQGWGPSGPIAYNPLEPTIDMVDFEVLAHVLSQQCRFAGHTNQFYSVAQHCVHVSEHCSKKNALWGLLHDASEALIVDVPRPLKRSEGFKFYMEVEARVMEQVCVRYGLQPDMPEDVRAADDLLLALEFRDLMYFPLRHIIADSIHNLDLSPFRRLIPWPPAEAEQRFLNRYEELNG